jgi:hypothetical protein
MASADLRAYAEMQEMRVPMVAAAAARDSGDSQAGRDSLEEAAGSREEAAGSREEAAGPRGEAAGNIKQPRETSTDATAQKTAQRNNTHDERSTISNNITNSNDRKSRKNTNRKNTNRRSKGQGKSQNLVWTQAKALIWKDFILKRRSPCTTIVELLCPTALFLMACKAVEW